MEHIGHFPTSMEMCMDDCLTLTTEKSQQKQFQGKTSEQSCSTHSISPDSQKNTVRSHVEFPPGMESILIFLGKQFLQGNEKFTLLSMEDMPSFPGKQFLQGKGKFVDTGTFRLGTIILINFLNRYSALSALTHQTTEPGRVHQENFKKMEISDMKTLPDFNANAETTLQMDASKKGPRASLIQKGKDIPITDTFSRVTPMNPEDDIQLPIRKANMITTHILTCILMSVQPQDSLCNKLDRLRKSTAQGNQLTRLSHYINTGFPCDNKSLPTDLHKHWNHRETLSIKSRIFVMMNIIMSTICMITTQHLMSEHSSDSISNRLAQPEKNTSQKKHITRLIGHNNTDQLCDRESLPTDLPESWPYKELLHNKSSLISYGDTRQHVHQEFYILPRPSKAMAQWKFQYMQKEVYILSRPRKFQYMQKEVYIL